MNEEGIRGWREDPPTHERDAESPGQKQISECSILLQSRVSSCMGMRIKEKAMRRPPSSFLPHPHVLRGMKDGSGRERRALNSVGQPQPRVGVLLPALAAWDMVSVLENSSSPTHLVGILAWRVGVAEGANRGPRSLGITAWSARSSSGRSPGWTTFPWHPGERGKGGTHASAHAR